MLSKSELFEFYGGQKPLIRRGGLHVTCDAHFGTRMTYLSQQSCENLVRIRCAFQELSFEFSLGGGQKTPIMELHMTHNAHFRTRPSYSSQRSCVKIWFGLVELFRSYRVHKHYSGGQKPPLWRLPLTCDAHFLTRMHYSSQKSYVKILFGLVEIGGMLSLRGVEDTLLGGLHVTCNAHFRTCPSYSRLKPCVKIWFGLVEAFKSYRVCDPPPL